MPRTRGTRTVAAVIATVVVLAAPAWMWQRSLTGDRYSVMSMGYPDFGGGPGAMSNMSGMAGMDHASHQQEPISISTLTADPRRRADVRVDLVARKSTWTLAGQQINGFTLNGSSPGPTITARVGQLVEVHVHNESVTDGMTLHWHGVDVPNAEDGTAGVTQDEIAIGADYTYRFVPDRAGTFWYHSHQVADAQVKGGLLGALVIYPARTPTTTSVISLLHTYAGVATLNGRAGDQVVAAQPGQQIRVRVINTDNGPFPIWSDAPYTVAAVDGTETNQPTPVRGRYLTVTAGGRADVLISAPTDGSAARLQISGNLAVLVGGDAARPTTAPAQPSSELDLLHYGKPTPLGFDPAKADRHFEYRIGHRFGFVHGKPGLYWSINSHLYPNVPMFVVRRGDVVQMTISNSSGDVHPMHLHGHRAVVLSRNGVPVDGSPWWVDSLNVRDGESYVIAFVADNPGIWMDHCHNLGHTAQGMIAHLMYEGYTTPYEIGGPGRNYPE